MINTDQRGKTQIYTLRGADQTYRRMLETMSEGAALLSDHAVVLYSNQRLSALLKQPLQTVLGADMTRFVCAGDQATFRQLLDSGRHGLVRGNISLQNAEGELVPIQLACSALANGDGNNVSIVVTDMTEHMLAKQALLDARSQLELKVRERTEKLRETITELEAFSYSLSHDLRAPLRAIIGFSQLVLEEIQDHAQPACLDHLRKVISAATRMDHLVLDLLAMSKLSQQQFLMEPIDLENLLQQIIAERPALQAPNVEINLHLPLLAVRGHEGLVTQCLTNLLDNAVKFVASGIKPKVDVSTAAIGSQVRITIADNGIGISPEAQPQLFRMFSRIHSGIEYEGTGIGLVVVRRAIERMGGQFGCESQPGKGSRFWIQLEGAP